MYNIWHRDEFSGLATVRAKKKLPLLPLARRPLQAAIAGLAMLAIAALVAGLYWYSSAQLSQANNLSFRVNYFYRPAGLGPMKPLTSGSDLHSGDHYGLWFVLEGVNTPESYVYILQTDNSLRIHCLFPLQSFKGVAVDQTNPVYPGQIYHVPGEGKAFELDRITGRERIYFLAFRQREDDLELHCLDPSRVDYGRLDKLNRLLKENRRSAGMSKRSVLIFNHLD